MRAMLAAQQFDWLVFNGTSTQKDQFVPTAGNRLSRPRMANGIKCIITYVTRKQCNTVHSKTLQLPVRNNRLSNRMTYLLITYIFNNSRDMQEKQL